MRRRRKRPNITETPTGLAEQWLVGSVIHTPWGSIEPRINYAKLGSRCHRCAGSGRSVAAWYSAGTGAGGGICRACWDELGTTDKRLPWFWAMWLYNLINIGFISRDQWPRFFREELAKWALIEQAVAEERTSWDMAL